MIDAREGTLVLPDRVKDPIVHTKVLTPSQFGRMQSYYDWYSNLQGDLKSHEGVKWLYQPHISPQFGQGDGKVDPALLFFDTVYTVMDAAASISVLPEGSAAVSKVREGLIRVGEIVELAAKDDVRWRDHKNRLISLNDPISLVVASRSFRGDECAEISYLPHRERMRLIWHEFGPPSYPTLPQNGEYRFLQSEIHSDLLRIKSSFGRLNVDFSVFELTLDQKNRGMSSINLTKQVFGDGAYIPMAEGDYQSLAGIQLDLLKKLGAVNLVSTIQEVKSGSRSKLNGRLNSATS